MTQMGTFAALRDLDRRVLRLDQAPATPEIWAAAMSRWKLALLAPMVVGLVAVLVAWLLSVPMTGVIAFMIPGLLIGTFRAGQMKAEHDRISAKAVVIGRLRAPTDR